MRLERGEFGVGGASVLCSIPAKLGQVRAGKREQVREGDRDEREGDKAWPTSLEHAQWLETWLS